MNPMGLGIKNQLPAVTNSNLAVSSQKAFDTVWNPGLPYKLSEVEFSTSLIKLIASFLTNRKFKIRVEGEFLRQQR
jgi:hypothetical protein